MEFLVAIASIYFLWKIFSNQSKAGAQNLNSRQYKRTGRRNRNHSNRHFDSRYGGYSGRAAYSPIQETASGIPIKSDFGYRTPFKPSNRNKSDFSYPENPNPQEFLVYLLASEELGALKIGVGTSGRVLQLLNSTIRSEYGFENVGWKVLKTAAFSSGPHNFESGRECAYEAERRVLFYWRKHLKQPAKVSQFDMGWAELDYLGSRGYRRTKGYSETVDIYSVCESTTWKIVKKTPGYLGEGNSFYEHRTLRSNPNTSISSSIPPGYLEYISGLTKTRSNGEVNGVQDLVSYDGAPAETSSHPNVGSLPLSKSIRKNKPMPKSDGTKEGKFWARVQKVEGGCWNSMGQFPQMLAMHKCFGKVDRNLHIAYLGN